MKIQYYKREKTPKYSESQAVKAQKISRKLVNHLYDQNCSIIMDDEKYFPLTGNQMPGITQITKKIVRKTAYITIRDTRHARIKL